MPFVNQSNEDAALTTALEDALKAHPCHPFIRLAILASLTGYCAGRIPAEPALLHETIEKNIMIGLAAATNMNKKASN